MASIIKNMIEYAGLVDNPQALWSKYFKQLNLQENQVLPPSKPSIRQIIRIVSDVEIKNKRIIITPKGHSIEGQILTGKKLIVDGLINEEIEYMADEPAQSVHIVHFKQHFSTSIIVPDTSVVQAISVLGYIEDMFAEVIEDKRSIYISVSLLLDIVSS